MDWLVEVKQQTSADYQLCVARFHYDGGGGCPVLAELTISVKACDDVCAGLARALWEAVCSVLTVAARDTSGNEVCFFGKSHVRMKSRS